MAANAMLEFMLKVRKQEAIDVIRACSTDKGFSASASQSGYGNILFTRDLCISVDGLVQAGFGPVVEKHFNELEKKQASDGSIPVFFPGSRTAWVVQKAKRAILEGEGINMLLRKLDAYAPAALDAIQLLGDLIKPDLIPELTVSHKTTDTELHYIDGIAKYANASGNDQFFRNKYHSMKRALLFAEQNFDNGLYSGNDWRDNVAIDEQAALLSNNILLIRAYEWLGASANRARHEAEVHRKFWNGQHHTDKSNKTGFDVYGQSLAALSDLVPASGGDSVIEQLAMQITENGIRANTLESPANLRGEAKASVNQVNQYGKVWPFVTGHAVLALNYLGETRLANQLFEIWTKTPGFNEWYEPGSPEGKGAKDQLWSAAMYLHAGNSLGAFK
jgi:glycogen debranching enzyme